MELAYHIFIALMLLWNSLLLTVIVGGGAYFFYKKQVFVKIDNLLHLMMIIRKEVKELPSFLPANSEPSVITTIEDLDQKEFSNIVKEFMDQGWTKQEAYQRANEIMMEKVAKYMEGGMNHYDDRL